LVVNLNNTWKPLTALGGYDDALARQMSGSTLDLVVFIVKVCPGIGAASSARLEALLSSRANVETVFGGHAQVVHGSNKVVHLGPTKALSKWS